MSSVASNIDYWIQYFPHYSEEQLVGNVMLVVYDNHSTALKKRTQ